MNLNFFRKNHVSRFISIKGNFPNFFPQSNISRSLLSIEAVSVGFGPNESKEVSSAKIKTSDSRSFWISFI